MYGKYRRIFDYQKLDYNRRKAIIIDGRPDHKLCLGIRFSKLFKQYLTEERWLRSLDRVLSCLAVIPSSFVFCWKRHS